MNKTRKETNQFLQKIKAVKTKHTVIVCPSFTSLDLFSHSLFKSPIKIGAQNIFPEEKGAFTGEISPLMLKELGCEYVLVGHSERRKYFSETDEFTNKKVLSAQRHMLIPILCIGETLVERKRGKTFSVIKKQLVKGLRNASSHVMVAYEPIWAIGTGNHATLPDVLKVHHFMRSFLEKKYGDYIPILYGGSVSPAIIQSYLSENLIDGVLVGNASLDPDIFLKLIT